MIVHFPIALIIVGFLFDAISLFVKKEFFSTAGFYLLILGTLGVVAAFFSGTSAGSGITEAGTLKQALETHEGAAELALWLMVITAVVRIALVATKKYQGGFKYAALVLFLLGVLAIARTGYYGGDLVFRHAAGVQFNLGFDSGAGDSEKE
jgi:uncharacterized membrane protein